MSTPEARLPDAGRCPGAFPSWCADVFRRVLDVGAAGALLLPLLPGLILIALLVLFSSRGPVLFIQERVGQGGRRFRLYKFRTMVTASAGPAVTAEGDVRITPIGRSLRRWKLDELPQLFNVLRGDMSLVGPRPEVPAYVRYYSEAQRRVLSVRPGITGVSQLEYRHEQALLTAQNDAESFYIQTILPAKLALDLRYIDERTLAGDLVLLLHTVVAILR